MASQYFATWRISFIELLVHLEGNINFYHKITSLKVTEDNTLKMSAANFFQFMFMFHFQNNASQQEGPGLKSHLGPEFAFLSSLSCFYSPI